MSNRVAIALIAVVAAVPRLAALLHERHAILGSLIEKSDRFARVLVESGTLGYIPGRPSGNLQPLYAWFLATLYWVVDRHWLVVGLAQIGVAVATALIVYAIGVRVASRRVGLVAAIVATLEPFLIWHDIHVNREILDGLLAASLTYAAVVAAEQGTVALAGVVGAIGGVAVLGNARLALLPLAVAVYVAWGRPLRRALVLVAASLIGAALIVAPWVARNQAVMGCAVITTDARALWKANNPATRDILANGGWIDDVPEPVGAPPWPELAADLTRSGKPTTVDECAQVTYYQDLVFDFWRDHPGEKALLAAQATKMLWSPTFTKPSEDPGLGRLGTAARDIAQPIWMIALYTLAIAGAFLARRRFVALVILLLGYQTLAAMLFAGTMRYRAPWDFLLALLAAHAIVAIAARVREKRRRTATTG